MAVFTAVSPDAFASWLAANYGIAATSPPRPIADGIENSNYAFESADGRRRIFTIFEVWDFAVVGWQLAFAAHLADKKMPVPKPHQRINPMKKNGEFAARWNDEKPAAVVPFVEGEFRPAPTSAECKQMGEAVADLHLAAADFNRRMENPRGAKWRKKTAEKIADKLDSDSRRLLADEIAFQSQGDFSSLPSGACHCDLFRNNVLWQNGKINGVIDFYFGGDDLLIYDLAVCINDWCIRGGNPDEGFDEARLASLIEGYRRRRPLNGMELDTLPVAMRMAALRFWISRLHDWHFPRRAEILTPHDPSHFYKMLLLCRKNSDAAMASINMETSNVN